MSEDWKGSISLHEAQQESLGASYGTKNSRAYREEFGEEYTGQMEGEIGAAELNLNYNYMDGLVSDKKSGRFISVISDGKFHEKVTEDTEGAVLREYELRDGTKGSKWELVYQKVENVYITNVEFEDGDYGKNILVTLSDGENEIVWAQGTKTNFGEDLMKKLPAVDFAEKVSIQPYSFPSEKTGKPVRGVNIYQKSDKVLSHFWDGEKIINGLPEVDKEEAKGYDSDDWISHFTTVRKFLVDYIKSDIIPKFASDTDVTPTQTNDEKEIKPEDIPF